MMEFSYIVELMSYRGILVDVQKLHETSHDLHEKIHKQTVQLRKWSGLSSLNTDSPKQLRQLFFQSKHGTCKAAHEVLERSEKTHEPSTDSKVLTKLKADGCRFADVLLQCRFLSKIRNTYLTGKDGMGGLLQFIESDGRVHPRWNQHLVKSQRLSANNPPMQTMPRGNIIRNLFIPSPGYCFVVADSKQSELRVIAVMADDKPLLETFAKGGDPHSETGSDIYNVPLEKVTKQQRQHGKGVNFSVVFLQQARSLGESIGVTERKAQQYLDRWYAKHFKVREFQKKLEWQIRAKGFVESPHGRLRHFPDFQSKTYGQQMEDIRAGTNHPIQCGSRLMVQRTMIAIQKVFEQHLKWDAGFVCDMHDGFLIEVKKQYVEKVVKIVKREGERPDPDLKNYSFPWDVKILKDRWYETE